MVKKSTDLKILNVFFFNFGINRPIKCSLSFCVRKCNQSAFYKVAELYIKWAEILRSSQYGY